MLTLDTQTKFYNNEEYKVDIPAKHMFGEIFPRGHDFAVAQLY